jgi:hypothetical protein
VLACSADAVDLGDGPLAPAGTADAALPRNIVCESGIDCQGGQCAQCLLESCFCDSSDDVRIPACVADGAILAAPPLLSADGTVLQFSVCSGGLDCRFYHWTAAFGLQEMPLAPEPTYAPAGISADGRQLLLIGVAGGPLRRDDDDDAVAHVYRYDIERNTGSVISTGLLEESAQMLPSGVVVGVSRGQTGARRLSRWSAQRGLEQLADVADLIPRAATPDGATIIGQLLNYGPAFQWSERDGLVQDLAAALAPGEDLSALAISADGSTIAGEIVGDRSGVYRWTEADGLDVMTGSALASDYLLLSDDGSVLAGTLEPPGSYAAEVVALPSQAVPFMWTPDVGFSRFPATIDALPRLFMPGDGSMVISESYSWRSAERSSTWSSSVSPRPVVPPRRVQLHGGLYGAITGLSHDGNVAAGTALCGGVDAVVRLNQLHEYSPF